MMVMMMLVVAVVMVMALVMTMTVRNTFHFSPDVHKQCECKIICWKRKVYFVLVIIKQHQSLVQYKVSNESKELYHLTAHRVRTLLARSLARSRARRLFHSFFCAFPYTRIFQLFSTSCILNSMSSKICVCASSVVSFAKHSKTFHENNWKAAFTNFIKMNEYIMINKCTQTIVS